ERDIEAPGLEQRHVLRAALGVALLDGEARIDLVNRVGHRGAVDGKSAAGGGGAQDHCRLPRAARRRRHGGYPTTAGRTNGLLPGLALADHSRFEAQQPAVDALKFLGDLAAEAIELLIDRDNAFADELDLVHEPIGDHVEVPPRLGGARGDLGAEIQLQRRGAGGDLSAQLAGDLRLELGLELRLELGEAAVQVGDELLIHAATLTAGAPRVKCGATETAAPPSWSSEIEEIADSSVE